MKILKYILIGFSFFAFTVTQAFAQSYEDYFTDFGSMGKISESTVLDKPDSFKGIAGLMINWDGQGPFATFTFFSRGTWKFTNASDATIITDNQKFETMLVRQDERTTRLPGGGNALYYKEEFMILPSLKEFRSMVYSEELTIRIGDYDFSIYPDTRKMLKMLFEKKGWNKEEP
jgi:hypothetical protein